MIYQCFLQFLEKVLIYLGECMEQTLYPAHHRILSLFQSVFKLFKEAQERYEKARLKSVAYSDANRHAIFAEKQSEITKLENEMQLQYQAYSQVAAQLRMAEAKVQEDTPAFTTLLPATVPVKKTGPKRSRNVLILLILALLAVTSYIFHKEGHLIPLLKSSHSHEDDFDEFSLADLVHLLNSDKK